jgi:hypothetical protein
MQISDIWSKSLAPGILDLLAIGIYLILIFMIAFYTQNKRLENNTVYKYYVWGLFAKIAGALAMAIIYTAYYKEGGDTTNYYRSSEALINSLFQTPLAFLRVLGGEMNAELYHTAFNNNTGHPMYAGKPNSFIIVRITSLFTLLGFKNYFTSNILFAWFFFNGFWKLFLLATKIYPRYHKAFAFTVLFFPSVMFWASGISKDTVALAMTGWFLYSLYMVFIEKKKIIANIFILIISSLLIIFVKAYIFVAIIPGGFIWLAWNYLKKIENPVLRMAATPIAVGIFFMLGLGFLAVFKNYLGEYGTIDGIIEKAIITYEDHSRSVQYGYNFYSLGEFDGTRWDFFSKAPAAIMAGLFRPYLWEVRNPVMLLAALENTAFFILVVIILWRTGPIKAARITLDEPLVIFSLTFAVVFAFAVGISTANFGALARLKTPLIPFLGIGLFTLFYRSMEIKKENRESENKDLSISR